MNETALGSSGVSMEDTSVTQWNKNDPQNWKKEQLHLPAPSHPPGCNAQTKKELPI